MCVSECVHTHLNECVWACTMTTCYIKSQLNSTVFSEESNNNISWDEQWNGRRKTERDDDTHSSELAVEWVDGQECTGALVHNSAILYVWNIRYTHAQLVMMRTVSLKFKCATNMLIFSCSYVLMHYALVKCVHAMGMLACLLEWKNKWTNGEMDDQANGRTSMLRWKKDNGHTQSKRRKRHEIESLKSQRLCQWI